MRAARHAQDPAPDALEAPCEIYDSRLGCRDKGAGEKGTAKAAISVHVCGRKEWIFGTRTYAHPAISIRQTGCPDSGQWLAGIHMGRMIDSGPMKPKICS